MASSIGKITTSTVRTTGYDQNDADDADEADDDDDDYYFCHFLLLLLLLQQQQQEVQGLTEGSGVRMRESASQLAVHKNT